MRPRNPFRLRTVESIESDADFLRLFGPGVLDLLPEDAVSHGVHFIRSAPGGGKTSLLKAFTPSVLLSLHNLRKSDSYKDVFSRLKDLEVVDDKGVRVIGVMLPCGRTLPALADLDLPSSASRRLLLALLDARLMLQALRNALEVQHLDYPGDLCRLRVSCEQEIESVAGLVLPCDGVEAHRWAMELERSVAAVIDSLAGPAQLKIVGRDSLLTLTVLDHHGLTIDGRSPADGWLVLLDDVHRLSADQRSTLREALLTQRSTTSVWIAERLEALSAQELLGQGALPGRDYESVTVLEYQWRQHSRRFETVAQEIAERRARMSVESIGGHAALGSFVATLDGNLESPEWLARIQKALEVVTERVEALVAGQGRYQEWLKGQHAAEGSAFDQLLGWRVLEILVERDWGKAQQSLDLVLPRQDDSDSAVRNAAELFLSKEHDLPYYYGLSRLAYLGSYNFEQFLRLSGDLFEESMAAAVLRKPTALGPARQHEILRAAAEGMLRGLPLRARNGHEVLTFLEAVGTFCNRETYRPTAPYAPGVTGVALSMREAQRVMGASLTDIEIPYRSFAEVLRTALSNNLLLAVPDYRVKGGSFMVLYLNRLLCARYGLPVLYGGFREKPLRELMSWLTLGYRPTDKQALPL